MSWRMEKPCDSCPFNSSGFGLRLRRSLRPGRFKEILNGLRRDLWFPCHKTADETGDGSNKYCAGALAWQDKRGITTNYQRAMERVSASFKTAALRASLDQRSKAQEKSA